MPGGYGGEGMGGFGGGSTGTGSFGGGGDGGDGYSDADFGDAFGGNYSAGFSAADIGQDPFSGTSLGTGSALDLGVDLGYGTYGVGNTPSVDFSGGITFGRDGIGRAELSTFENVVDFLLGPIDLQKQVSVNAQGLPSITGTSVSVNPAGLLGLAVPVPGASVLTGYLGNRLGIPSLELAQYNEKGLSLGRGFRDAPEADLMGGIGGMFDTVSDALGAGTVTAPPETQGGEGFVFQPVPPLPPPVPQVPVAAPPAPAPAPAPTVPAPVTPPPVGPVVTPPAAYQPVQLPERFYTRDPFRPFQRQAVPQSPFYRGIGSLPV